MTGKRLLIWFSNSRTAKCFNLLVCTRPAACATLSKRMSSPAKTQPHVPAMDVSAFLVTGHSTKPQELTLAQGLLFQKWTTQRLTMRPFGLAFALVAVFLFAAHGSALKTQQASLYPAQGKSERDA